MDFTHINEKGEANMVDISPKSETSRIAVATGTIRVSDKVINAVAGHDDRELKKGDIIGAARIAGIMAAKKTADLIPLCHQLLLTEVKVDFEVLSSESKIKCTVRVSLCGRTGAEMEALTAVSVALLTIYDMCKAVDRSMEIGDIMLLEKDGGKSGHFTRASK